VHAGVQDRGQVLVGEVRPRVADLVRVPPVPEGPVDLPRRTDVEPDPRTSFAEETQELGLALRLERQPDQAAELRDAERVAEPRGLLPDPGQVVGVGRRAVRARELFGVAARDPQTPVVDVEAGT
jgi:hypothetical protein